MLDWLWFVFKMLLVILIARLFLYLIGFNIIIPVVDPALVTAKTIILNLAAELFPGIRPY
jgi:hypothetical protein